MIIINTEAVVSSLGTNIYNKSKAVYLCLSILHGRDVISANINGLLPHTPTPNFNNLIAAKVYTFTLGCMQVVVSSIYHCNGMLPDFLVCVAKLPPDESCTTPVEH